MMTARSHRRIALLAHIGNGNLGDEATLAVFIENIRQRDPEAVIFAFTANPTDTALRHCIQAFPFRRSSSARDPSMAVVVVPVRHAFHRLRQWLKVIRPVREVFKGLRSVVQLGPRAIRGMVFLIQSARRLRGTQLLVIAGSGPLNDYWGGPGGYPLSIFKWTILAKSMRVRVAFLSVGAGPIASPVSKLLFRLALSRADYRSFRDQGSKTLVEQIGIRAENHVLPDLVHSLQPPRPHCGPTREGPRPVVGINPIPYFDSRYWPEASDAVYQQYVRTLGSFALWLIGRGYDVLFFPTQLQTDPLVITDIELIVKRGAARGGAVHLLERLVSSLDDVFSAIAMTDVVVASRFHGIIFSLLLNKPVLGISYFMKTDELMADMGQSQFVLHINSLDLSSLIERFGHLEANLQTIGEQIGRRRRDYQRALALQYDRILALAPCEVAVRSDGQN